MKIEIEVSDKTEATHAPWWLIIDPAGPPKCTYIDIANTITGPFFSREEAQKELDQRPYDYTDKAVIWCESGYRSGQYNTKYTAARNEQKLR